MQLMLQATVCDCLVLDPFAFEKGGLSAHEVDVSRGKIVETFVITGMVVMPHEGGDLAFEIVAQVVVLKQDAVLERLGVTSVLRHYNTNRRLAASAAPSFLDYPSVTWRCSSQRIAKSCRASL
jgi:hypothetical protein